MKRLEQIRRILQDWPITIAPHRHANEDFLIHFYYLLLGPSRSKYLLRNAATFFDPVAIHCEVAHFSIRTNL